MGIPSKTMGVKIIHRPTLSRITALI